MKFGNSFEKDQNSMENNEGADKKYEQGMSELRKVFSKSIENGSKPSRDISEIVKNNELDPEVVKEAVLSEIAKAVFEGKPCASNVAELLKELPQESIVSMKEAGEKIAGSIKVRLEKGGNSNAIESFEDLQNSSLKLSEDEIKGIVKEGIISRHDNNHLNYNVDEIKNLETGFGLSSEDKEEIGLGVIIEHLKKGWIDNIKETQELYGVKGTYRINPDVIEAAKTFLKNTRSTDDKKLEFYKELTGENE